MDIETLALAKGYTNKQIKKLSVNGIKGDKGDPGKDAVIDTTLSNSGEAADAKVVGNEISSLKEDLVSVIYQYVNISEKDIGVPKKLYIPIGAKFRIETLNGENFGQTITLRLLDIDKNEIDYY